MATDPIRLEHEQIIRASQRVLLDFLRRQLIELDAFGVEGVYLDRLRKSISRLSSELASVGVEAPAPAPVSPPQTSPPLRLVR